jgi:FkbM family methyltransferase
MSFLQLINSVLKFANWRLVNIGKKATSSLQVDRFYRATETCQIPELASLYELFFGRKSEGTFVEIGAFDGISFSNSSCLADVGWSGILVEPIPEHADICRKRYASNPKIRVVETAIGDTDCEIEIMRAGPLTTSSMEHFNRYKNVGWSAEIVAEASNYRVKQKTLDDLLCEYLPDNQIDVLIVDVEGAEASVFAGFDIDKWKPKMLIIELAHTHPDLREVSLNDARIQETIESHGYSIVYKDKINTVFITKVMLMQ